MSRKPDGVTAAGVVVAAAAPAAGVAADGDEDVVETRSAVAVSVEV